MNERAVFSNFHFDYTLLSAAVIRLMPNFVNKGQTTLTAPQYPSCLTFSFPPIEDFHSKNFALPLHAAATLELL